MSVGTGVFWKLSTDTGITAIVGAEVWPNASPNNKYPFVAYNYNEVTENLLNNVPVTKRFNLSVTAVAQEYETAQTLAAAIVASLNKQKNVVWNGINIQGCYHKPEETEEASSQDSPQHKFYAISLTFKLLTN